VQLALEFYRRLLADPKPKTVAAALAMALPLAAARPSRPATPGCTRSAS
jgi:hypothetical protein